MFTCELDKFVNREKELALVLEKVSRLASGDPFAPHERVIYFLGPSNIGKSFLLDASLSCLAKKLSGRFVSIKFDSLGNKSISASLREIDKVLFDYLGGSLTKGSEQSLQIINQSIHAKINSHLGEKTFVLFIDEIDTLSSEYRKDLEAHMLVELLKKPRTLVVMAGRTPVFWSEFSLALNPANTFVLDAFNEKNTGEQLEKIKQGSAPLSKKVHELGGGVPGNNRKLSEQLVGTPPVIPDDLIAIQSLLADVKKEIKSCFHSILEAICILPNFHPDDVALLLDVHPALDGYWDEARIRSVFTELNKVRVGPGGLIYYDGKKRNWVMDEPIRGLFEKELHLRAPELWRILHRTAWRMYKTWSEEFKSEVFNEKSAYHQQCLQSAGYTCDDLGNEG